VQPPQLAVTAALGSGPGQVIIAGRQPGQDFRAAGLPRAADREARVRPGGISGCPEQPGDRGAARRGQLA